MRVLPTLAGALLAAGLLGGVPALPAQDVAPLPAQLQDFDACVDQARETLEVPGIAAAIVKDGLTSILKSPQPVCCQQSSSPRRRGSSALNLNVPGHWVPAFAGTTICFVRTVFLIVC
ncbi:hypothetical protein DSC_06035 [Pseudoxanthomonas spadix BD-a59]|jgi:hypothetical protein|uniref:Uncharacterized protein n=2 Tax=Pseudoxanthomonas spadix TaxID=415229 RepID=G7UR47_PSEUP|nr:hypothetical protein DSC_06035 [Pseudoxanthomonas spadix BD-a59]